MDGRTDRRTHGRRQNYIPPTSSGDNEIEKGMPANKRIVREPAIGLTKWLRPKDLKGCSYVEKCAEFKIQTPKKTVWYTKVLCAAEYPRVGNISK